MQKVLSTPPMLFGLLMISSPLNESERIVKIPPDFNLIRLFYKLLRPHEGVSNSK